MGYVLGHGFLAMYQGLRGPMGLFATQILGLPLSAEYTVTVGGGPVVRQDFERGSLIWDERQAEPWKCYFAAVGKEVQQVKSLQEQFAQAQQQLQQVTAQLAAAPSAPATTSSPPSADAVAHAVIDLLGQTLLKSAASACTR